MHVTKGDRVFVTGIESYADVEREGILGLTSSICATCDDGVVRAFTGTTLTETIVNTTTGKNGKGTDHVVPTDVKKVGPEILDAIGIDQDTKIAYFQKFMVLPKETRKQYIDEWLTVKDDATTRSTFLTSLVAVIEVDDLFIRTQATLLLGHLEEATRVEILTKLYSLTTTETRQALIINYTTNKTDKYKTEEFVQGIYQMTLDNSEYMRIQMIQYGKGAQISNLAEKVDLFLVDKSSSIDEYAAVWRARKYYRTKQSGSRYTKSLLRKY